MYQISKKKIGVHVMMKLTNVSKVKWGVIIERGEILIVWKLM